MRLVVKLVRGHRLENPHKSRMLLFPTLYKKFAVGHSFCSPALPVGANRNFLALICTIAELPPPSHSQSLLRSSQNPDTSPDPDPSSDTPPGSPHVPPDRAWKF